MSTEPDRLIEIPFDVAPHEHGLRIDLFLSRRLKRMSRSLAARLVREGRVRRVPEGVLKASARVFLGDRVILKRKPLGEAPPDDIVVPVVHDDPHIVAVNKPGNLVVHPTASHYHRTLIRIMRERLQDEALDLAHRIDKETSGLVLLARTFQAASSLKKQFARREVDKAYLAVVRGAPARDAFVLDTPVRLADTVSKVVMEATHPEDPRAQAALTEVEVLARGEGVALVEARPKTGRQHQIRVHLQHAGHPLLGDKLYLGGEAYFLEAIGPDYPPEQLVEEVGHDRQALHAWRASFRHPATGCPMTLTAPLAPDLAALARRHGIPIDQIPGAVWGVADSAPPELRASRAGER